MILEIGELRQQLTKDLGETLEKVIDAKQELHSYHILIYANFDPLAPSTIRTKIVTTISKPPMLLGTMCFHVDNKKGTITPLWVLPLDIPLEGIIDTNEVSELVYKSAEKVKHAIRNA